MADLPFLPQPKPEPRKKAKRRADREWERRRRLCRQAVVEREGYRSRLTRMALTLRSAHVHEVTRRSQGGDPLNPADCIALLPHEHDYFTWNYLGVEVLDEDRGTDGPLRWLLLPRGRELLLSVGTRRRMDRAQLALVWENRTREDGAVSAANTEKE